MARAWLATWIALASAGCSSVAQDVPRHAEDPAAAWQEQFERGERFQRSGFQESAQRNYERALSLARALLHPGTASPPPSPRR